MPEAMPSLRRALPWRGRRRSSRLFGKHPAARSPARSTRLPTPTPRRTVRPPRRGGVPPTAPHQVRTWRRVSPQELVFTAREGTMRKKLITIASKGPSFDGRTAEDQPLGGVENAVAELAGALARRGHQVRVHNNCGAPVRHRGVEWTPIGRRMPFSSDLYVANRDHELLLGAPLAKARVLWLHNPGWKVDNWRYKAKMRLLPPKVVVLGEYHRSTCPAWVQERLVVVPLGLSGRFLARGEATEAPPPRAIFTSNPARGLDWLLRVWAERIQPKVPRAELHLFSGPEVYQMRAGTGFDHMKSVLAAADALRGSGVVRHDPVGRDKLAAHIAASRVMLYRGHEEETFCLALAEAQALGVPCVVQPIGSVAERVRDGVTGFVAADEADFARRAVELLTDADAWMGMHRSALSLQRSRTWDDVAGDFERLMP